MTALAPVDKKELVLPSGVVLLDDNAQYTNRFEFVSDSGKVYLVAQNKKKRGWSCSCPGWIYHNARKCKHLTAFGLPHGQKPFEIGALRVAALPGNAPEPVQAPALSLVTGGKPSKGKGKAQAALPAAPVQGCPPVSVETRDGKVIVTWDAKDAARVFAMLAQMSGGNS